MKLFSKAKDGGPESPVDAYFVVECKGLFSIALLKFNKGGREAFHTHAFDAWTWFLKGDLTEQTIVKGDKHGYLYQEKEYSFSLTPKLTRKSDMHRVVAEKDSWCLTVRGPWQKNWTEYNAEKDVTTTLSHGRHVVATQDGVQ